MVRIDPPEASLQQISFAKREDVCSVSRERLPSNAAAYRLPYSIRSRTGYILFSAYDFNQPQARTPAGCQINIHHTTSCAAHLFVPFAGRAVHNAYFASVGPSFPRKAAPEYDRHDRRRQQPQGNHPHNNESHYDYRVRH
jgi:hypothetical protein